MLNLFFLSMPLCAGTGKRIANVGVTCASAQFETGEVRWALRSEDNHVPLETHVTKPGCGTEKALPTIELEFEGLFQHESFRSIITSCFDWRGIQGKDCIE